MESIADRRSLRVIYVNRRVASTERNGCGSRQIFAHTHLVRGLSLMLEPTDSAARALVFLHTHVVRDCVKRPANRVAVTSR